MDIAWGINMKLVGGGRFDRPFVRCVNNIDAHGFISFEHVARDFPRVGELLVVQDFQPAHHASDRAFVGHQDVVFLVARDQEVTAAAMLIL